MLLKSIGNIFNYYLSVVKNHNVMNEKKEDEFGEACGWIQMVYQQVYNHEYT